MSEFIPKSMVITGRQPALGIAELESLYSSSSIKRLSHAALLNLPAEKIDYQRLGGAVKVGRIFGILDTTNWPAILDYLQKVIPPHLPTTEKNKFTLGISVYGLELEVKNLNKHQLGSAPV